MTKDGRSFLAVILTLLFLPAVTPGATGPAKPLGQVLRANRAHLGLAEAFVGSTIFPGDILSTEQFGGLQVKVAGAQLRLTQWTHVLLDSRAEGGVLATLRQGTVLFSSAGTQGIELRVSTAQIRPKTDGPTVAQVTIVGPKELIVISRRGALEFAVGAEAEMIPEGASYRVLLDPPEPLEPAAAQGSEGVGSGNEKRPKKSGRKRRAFAFILLGSAAAVTAIAIDEALEGPPAIESPTQP